MCTGLRRGLATAPNFRESDRAATVTERLPGIADPVWFRLRRVRERFFGRKELKVLHSPADKSPMSTNRNEASFTDLPRAAGLESSHCRRVAAWSVELANALQATPEEQDALERAALAHHLPPFLSTAKRKKFFRDLRIVESNNDNNSLDRVDEILACFHEMRAEGASASSLKLASILDVANTLDERFEWDFFATDSDEGEDPAVAAALDHLQTVAGPELERAVDTVPMLPAATQRSLKLLSRDDIGIADVEAIANLDPALADQLIRTANSDRCRPPRTLTSLSSAIKHAGPQIALRVLCCASLRPLFATAPLHRVWNHCIGVAQTAEHLARTTGLLDPSEAFLAGLVHDVGRLPMARLPLEFQQRFARVFKKGCEPLLIEKTLCPFTHADAGAMVVRNWGFPLAVSDAVEHHHEPERSDSKLASLLRLADEPADDPQDLPSILRRQCALNSLDLGTETLHSVHLFPTGVLDDLKFVA
jgi:putative nucleotidyltransferase with HDIG domain